MIKNWRSVVMLVGMLVLAGCNTTPSTIIETPLSARPQPKAPEAPKNGAIFQSAGYRPLLEDRKARAVGDTVVIVISERTSAGKQENNSSSKKSNVKVGAPSILGTSLDQLSAGADSSYSNSEKGQVTSSNNFTGTIGATVVDVYPNGNLLVAGEKQVAFDRGVEYVRFSGVVSPDNILSGNRVASTTVADAKFEYRTSNKVDLASFMSSMARFFYSLSPF